MDLKTAELINFSPLVELFGTFFEKLTNKHSHKDQLRKELAEFKCVLYTNQHNAANIDSYLETLNKKTIIPEQNPENKPEPPSNQEKTTFLSPNTNTENASKPKATNNSTKKIEILTMADFLRYRSIGQADKKQVLVSRYGHVQSLEKNPNNLYRTLGIHLFTLIFRSSSSEKQLAEIIDEVAAKRVQLSCATENLTHDDMSGVLCGFFSQLLRMKRNHESFLKIMQTFHEMIGGEKIFSTGIACFVKSKIYSLIDQKNFPYELISLRAIVQSKGFKDKIENNDYSILETLLRLVPFVFNKQVVVNLFQNGKLSEVIYQGPKPKKQKDSDIPAKEYDDANTIHLLVEKVFLTVTVFGLFPITSTPFIGLARSPIKTGSVNIIGNQEGQFKPVMTDSPTFIKKITKVRTLTIDTGMSSEQNLDYTAYLASNPSLNRISLQENANKYTVSSARLSYNPTYSKPQYLNSDNEVSKPNNEEGQNDFKTEGDISTTKQKENDYPNKNEKENEYDMGLNLHVSPSRVTNRYESGYLARRELNLLEAVHNQSFQDKRLTSNPRSSLQSIATEISNNFISPSSGEWVNRASSPVAINKLHQLRNNHVKAHSYNILNLKPTTPSSESGSAITNYHQSEESTPQAPAKSQNEHITFNKVEPSMFYQKSTFADKRNTSTNTNQRERNESDNTTQKTTESTLEQETPRHAQIKVIDSARTVSTTATTISNAANSVSHQSKEKLKNIVSMTPKGVIHLASNSVSLNSNDNPTYTRPTHVSKFANNISYTNKYKSTSTTVNLDDSESSKPVNKYQINSNFSYQGRISSPSSYKPSYTPQPNQSQNNSFNKDTSTTYRPYNNRSVTTYQNIGDYSSPVKYSAGETSQYSRSKNHSTSFGNQFTALSTNTSFNGNSQAYNTLQTGRSRLKDVLEMVPQSVAEQQS